MTYHLLGPNVEVIEAVLPALGGGATRSRNPSRPPFKAPPSRPPDRTKSFQHSHHRTLGVLALLFTVYLYSSLLAFPTGAGVGRPVVDKYGAMVKEGAKAFLYEEYKSLAKFVLFLGLILLVLFTVQDQTTKTDGVRTMFAFFLGAVLSATAGWCGMMVATDGNTRTTAACAGKEVKDSQGKVTGGTGSLNDGLRVAFKAGSVMGFVVVGADSA